MLTMEDNRALSRAEMSWLAPPRDEVPNTEAYLEEMDRRVEDEWVTRYLQSQQISSSCIN